MIILYIVIIAIVGFYIKIELFKKKKNSSFPDASQCELPILGAKWFFSSMDDPNTFSEEFYDETVKDTKSGTFQTHVLDMRITYTTNHNLLYECLKHRPNDFLPFGTIQPVFNDMNIASVFSETGKKWKLYRSVTQPVFDRSNINNFTGILNDVVNRHFEIFNGKFKDCKDIKTFPWPDLQKFTLRSIINATFGCDTDSKLLDEIQECITVIGNELGNRIFQFIPIYKIQKHKKYNQAYNKLRSIYKQMVKELNPQTRGLYNFMRSSHIKLNSQELWGNFVTFLIAGLETTSLVLNHALYYMAKDSKVQDTLLKEASKLCDEDGLIKEWKDEFYASDSSKTLYAYKIILEALRIQTPVKFISVQASKDISIKFTDNYLTSLKSFRSRGEKNEEKHYINEYLEKKIKEAEEDVKNNNVKEYTVSFKKGDMMEGMVGKSSKLDLIYENPDIFNPDRWETLNGRSQYFLNFGLGSRTCIGNHFALKQAIHFLLKFITHYKLSLPKGAKLPKQKSFLVQTVKPWDLIITKR